MLNCHKVFSLIVHHPSKAELILNRMKNYFLLLIIAFFQLSCSSDELSSNFLLEKEFSLITELPNLVNESSGMICSDPNFIWTHNDSGGAPHLYEVDLLTGTIFKTVVLKNATNKDWESMTQDNEYTYLSDTGNNNGNRTDLVIYKIPTIDLQTKDSVTASSIFISYADQDDFSTSSKHNFDCEAIIPLGDHLYLFTKNRGNFKTNIYKVSKMPGTYVLEKEGSLEVEGLITDAAINSGQDQICLFGYNEADDEHQPFVWLLYDFSDFEFLDGKTKRIDFDLKLQMEAGCYKEDDAIYFTSEAEGGGVGKVYEVWLEDWI